MPTLFRLVYVSTATAPLTAAGADDLLAAARRHNARDGVSGSLLHADGTFAQILEGPVSVVEQTFVRIERDRRHTDVDVVVRCPIDERVAPAHPMAFSDLAWLGPDERARLGPLVRDGFVRVPSWQAVVREGELLGAFRVVFGEPTNEPGAEPGCRPRGPGRP